MYKLENTNYIKPIMPRMRTIAQCAEYFKQEDPETAVTGWFIQECLIKDENSTFKAWVRSGVKYLINLDKLIEYFAEVGYAS